MNIAIVDDEKLYLDALDEIFREELGRIGISDYKIDLFTSGESFLESYTPGKYRVVVLDIFMSEQNGIDVARTIRKENDETVLVFCTTSNDFASQSYEVSASFYLQKPLEKEKVLSMLRRLNLPELNKNNFIQLPDGYSLQLGQILYTEHYNHYITFHLRNGVNHEVYMTHGDAEELLLSHKGFLTISKGCIVNLNNVKKADKTVLRLVGDIELPVARRRAKEVLDAFMQFRLSKMEEEMLYS